MNRGPLDFEGLEKFMEALPDEPLQDAAQFENPPQVSFTFDREQYGELEEEEDREAFLTDLVNERIEDLESLLCSIDSADREEYVDGSLALNTLEFDDKSSTKGVLWVDYEGSTYWGCRDMDRTDEHSEKFTFEVDVERSQICVIGQVTKFEKPSPKDEL